MAKNHIIISDEATRIADLIEQIQATDKMMVLHYEDEHDFMYRQYLLRKSKLSAELQELLITLKIDFALKKAA